jgi:hypothetical protein
MSTREVRDAWGKVGDELAGLGLKLKLHAEQEFSDDDVRESDAALERLGEALDAAVEAVQHAAEDPAVREDLVETGRRLMDALSVTMNEATRPLRDRT